MTPVQPEQRDGRKSLYRCECGTEKWIQRDDVNRGHTTSCGCANVEAVTTHGHASDGKWSRTYNSWRGMRTRTGNPNAHNYHNYGGRGILCCERWAVFANFLEDMGERPEGKTIDRKNNDKGYYPENCKWATKKEQEGNKRNSKK